MQGREDTDYYEADTIITQERIENNIKSRGKLHEEIRDLPLADTAEGRLWCLKALHPADHEIKTTQYPGGSLVPTVPSYYQQWTEISAAPVVEGVNIRTWDLIAYMREDAVCPVSLKLRVHTDTTIQEYPVPWLNRQVTSYSPFNNSKWVPPENSTVYQAYTKFRKGKNLYRLTFAGLTGELVASSTTNQGTITAAQYQMKPIKRAVLGGPTVEVRDVTGTVTYDVLGQMSHDMTSDSAYPFNSTSQDGAIIANLGLLYDEGPMPESSLLQATNPYTGPAREGFYMPLKLSGRHKMTSTNQWYTLFGVDASTLARGFGVTQPWGVTNVISDATYVNKSGWPWYTGDPASGVAKKYFLYGLAPNGDQVGQVVMSGMSPEATVRLNLRVGYEFVPETDSEFATFAKAVPVPDSLAPKMYQEIAARLKDAYPMDYNDFGELKTLINKIAKKIVPALDVGFKALSIAPGPVGTLAKGAQTLTGAYLAPRRKTARQANRSAAKKASRAKAELEKFYSVYDPMERLTSFRKRRG